MQPSCKQEGPSRPVGPERAADLQRAYGSVPENRFALYTTHRRQASKVFKFLITTIDPCTAKVAGEGVPTPTFVRSSDTSYNKLPAG